MGTSSKQQRSTKKSRNAKKPSATSPTISRAKSTTSSQAIESKWNLLKKLDDLILGDSLVDLHTHLMGMGNADFWVTKIIEGYLPRAKSNVVYKFCKICEASNLTLGSLEKSLDWQRALVESRLFDGSAHTLLDIPGLNADDPSLPNEFLATMLQEEDSRYPNRDGPLRSLVRNWFEFLDSNGSYPDQNAILDTCKLALKSCMAVTRLFLLVDRSREVYTDVQCTLHHEGRHYWPGIQCSSRLDEPRARNLRNGRCKLRGIFGQRQRHYGRQQAQAHDYGRFLQ